MPKPQSKNKKTFSEDFIIIYVTMPSLLVAKEISRKIVEERLVAGVNISGSVWSYFHWKGAIEEREEACCFFKTKKNYFTKVQKRITELHPYEIPCIISFPLTQGNYPYLEWIHEILSI